MLWAVACAQPPRAPGAALVHVSDGRALMGTILEITLVTRHPARARELIERCFDETARLESIFTTWREDGELARLNARAGQGPQPASPELVRILRDAQGFARATGGAFDVTVGPLIALWRDAARRGELPDDASIAAARARVGAERVAIDSASGTVALEAGMAIDLGGLAKGWTLDRLGELLRREGVERALLDFGGSSVFAMGAPADADAWRVEVETAGVPAVIALKDEHLSVSANLGQPLAIGGREFGHIVDPRSGWSLRSRREARVRARDGATAEAWSTALIVLDRGEARALLVAAPEVKPFVSDEDEGTAGAAGAIP